jgi:transposase
MHPLVYYVGMDVHKRSISYCVKRPDGAVEAEGQIKATRQALQEWAKLLPRPCVCGLETTIFSHWIYYLLEPCVDKVYMGHAQRMKAICSGKKKNDRLDAAILADLLRANLFPAIQVVPEWCAELREVLRFRQLLIRCHVRMKNKMAGLLMASGVEYEKERLHGPIYFHQLIQENPDIRPGTRPLLQFSQSQTQLHQRMERRLAGELSAHAELAERVARLQTIPGVGKITALTWALEVGPPERLPSISQAVSYCGLVSAQRSSAGVDKRGPLSKQRNRFLQSTLVEAAKLACRYNPLLKELHERELQRGDRNRATLAVARKLVAYLWAADRGHQPAARPEPAAGATAA